MSDSQVAVREQGAVQAAGQADLLEKVVVHGDLSKLTAGERLAYYRRVCESLGLNPLTRPFDYITLNGKLTLYARRDATDQIRKMHRVSVQIVAREKIDDLYVVTARATMPDGRVDESIGAVNLSGLKGEALANALMKGETKAKRRVTLSIVGLGMMDETEAETVTEARRVVVSETGEIVDQGNGETVGIWHQDADKRARLYQQASVRLSLSTAEVDRELGDLAQYPTGRAAWERLLQAAAS